MGIEPSGVRVVVVHGGKESGPLLIREVVERLQAGSLAIDDVCWAEGARERAPLSKVLPTLVSRAKFSETTKSQKKRPTTRIAVIDPTQEQMPARVPSPKQNTSSAATPPPIPKSLQPVASTTRLLGWFAAALLFIVLMIVVGTRPNSTVGTASSSPNPATPENRETATPIPSETRAEKLLQQKRTFSFQSSATPATTPAIEVVGRFPSDGATPEASSSQSQTPIISNGMDDFRGERFPETRLRALTTNEVLSWSSEQIQYAINEMYARHGAEFLDTQITHSFEGFSWYHPQHGFSYDQVESYFSDVERNNLQLLGYYRELRKTVPPVQAGGGGSEPIYEGRPSYGDDSTRPEARFQYAPRPTYPIAARRSKLSGSGVFRLVVAPSGRVQSVAVVKSTGSYILDSQAIETLKQWRARPGQGFTGQVPITFRRPL